MKLFLYNIRINKGLISRTLAKLYFIYKLGLDKISITKLINIKGNILVIV